MAGSGSMAETLDEAAAAARACTICAAELPLGPRPVLRVSATARLLIIGQAPGTKVHASGLPWDDASGERLRGWRRRGIGSRVATRRCATGGMCADWSTRWIRSATG